MTPDELEDYAASKAPSLEAAAICIVLIAAFVVAGVLLGLYRAVFS